MFPIELQSHVWTPCPDCAPFHLRGPADALTLAVGWPELPSFGVLLVLLDADLRIETMVTNPEPALVFFPSGVERPGLPRPVHGVAVFSIADVTFARPARETVSLYETLQGHYRDQGIRLVDWVQIDFDEDVYRSLRIDARRRRGAAEDFLRAGTCT